MTHTAEAPTIDQLVGRAIPYLRRIFPFAVALAVVCVCLAAGHGPMWGVAAALVAVGGLVPIGIWIFRVARGLPFLAVVATQDLLWFGLPLASGHEEVASYRDDEILMAGVEFIAYATAMTLAYVVCISRPQSRPRSYLTLHLADPIGLRKAVWACLFALAACCVFTFTSLNGMIWPYIERLPEGSYSVLRAGFSVLGTAASLLLAFAFARGSLGPITSCLFAAGWILFVATLVANVFVSAIAPPAAAVAFGMFLGRGRLPWRFMAVIALVAVMLNFGKFTMRERYWGEDAERIVAVTDLPAYYMEWFDASWNAILGETELSNGEEVEDGQSLLERISTFHMLLTAQRGINEERRDLLNGQTYAVIPKLLVPRLLWKDKPRSQIGQVILNVHFGLQTLEQTHVTYISWGLLSEAYANFGSIVGPVMLGIVMGVALAFLERLTFGLPFDSLTSLLACVFFLSFTGINERVASTSLTMAFQMSMVVLLGGLPFLSRVSIARPVAPFGAVPNGLSSVGIPRRVEPHGRFRA